jgi:hypothetical protein
MKLFLIKSVVALGLATGVTACAAIYTYDGPFAGIPDGSTAGWSYTENVSDFGSGATIGSVTITFTISGGYNGDLHGYLNHGGVLVPLLDRVGTGSGSEPTYSFGFATSGFNNITLDDAATGNGSIHYVQNPAAGQSYQPDGGALASFQGKDPDGAWTLFFADLSSDPGGSHSQVMSWSLDITAVPEPVNVSLGIVAGLALAIRIARSRPVRGWRLRSRAALSHWIDAFQPDAVHTRSKRA